MGSFLDEFAEKRIQDYAEAVIQRMLQRGASLEYVSEMFPEFSSNRLKELMEKTTR